MVSNAITALFFCLLTPGQIMDGWHAPKDPGIYRVTNGLTAFVGVKPSAYPGMGSYPADVAPLLVPIQTQDREVRLSKHFVLQDFLCKGEESVVSVSPRLVTKLEAIISDLEGSGYACPSLRLQSGYRTPGYNRAIGNVTRHSRHIHGDAADMVARDFNSDGRVDRKDAQILMATVTRLDQDPRFAGGASIYPANGSHSWFVHTDTRGKATRW